MTNKNRTRAETYHVAVCANCGGTPDDDGGEYRSTPEQAIDAALEMGWTEQGEGLFCEDCAAVDDDA